MNIYILLITLEEIAIINHVWLAVMLIVAAERQATIGVLCSLSGVYRVSAALSAVIRDITTGTAYVWIHEGVLIV